MRQVTVGSRGSDLARAMAEDLARNHEGLSFFVEKVATGTLPRFELKAKRVKDERIVKGAKP